MATAKFILQGFTASTHIDALRWLFDLPAGIRNDATSYQGLVRLHRIVDQLYTVGTGSRTLIFHPKLYLVRAKEHAHLMIGSANLTLAGLNNNIEAGMLLGFDLNEAIDKAEIDEIER